MRKFVLFGTLVIVLVSLPIFAACTSSTTTTSTQQSPTIQVTTSTQTPTTMVATASPTEANWWDKFGTPQYGGTITIRTASVSGGSFDPDIGFGGAGGFSTNNQAEGLTMGDWTLDRNTWSYKQGFTPLEYIKGALADSWEQTDPSTITLHIRQGVHWQNKAPANGRELTAADVVYSFDRALGTGSGFTQPNPFIASMMSSIDRAKAIDKYTVQVKLKQPGIMGLYQTLESSVGFVPPEWDKLAGIPGSTTSSSSEPPSGGPPGGGPAGPGGPSEGSGPAPTGPAYDWKYCIGTGPWILTDFVVGTSMTFSRNPDYWGYDERYPQNKLPYADTLKELAIPDTSTALAALRTGQVDMMTDQMGGLTWQQGKSLAQSNPNIQISQSPRPGSVITLRCDHKPFTDINVRKALQMAINLPSIAAGYYGGTVDGKPVGLISPLLTGWATPYDQWPASLQQEYSYNPDKAKQLLADAGYPDGFDTDVVASSTQDMQLLQIVQSEFKDIGVNMTINQMDPMALRTFTGAGKMDQMAYDDGQAGMLWAPWTSLSMRVSNNPQNNFTYNNDPTYDAMIQEVNSATDTATMEQLAAKADLYSLQQHWSVNLCNAYNPAAWQPWIKGFSGDDIGMGLGVRARLWIDQSLKK